MRAEVPDVRELQFRVAARITHHDHAAAPLGRIQNAAQDLDEVRVACVVDDNPDGGIDRARERLSMWVRCVVERLGCLHDRSAQLLAHPTGAPQGA